MVTIVVTTLIGAVLNATTFIGGSYLVKALTGKDQDGEQKRHDLAVEKYNIDYNKWKEELANLELWKEQHQQQERDASHKFSKTDNSLRAYADAYADFDKKEPQFENYYTPSANQRKGEVIFTVLTVGGLVYVISKVI